MVSARMVADLLPYFPVLFCWFFLVVFFFFGFVLFFGFLVFFLFVFFCWGGWVFCLFVGWGGGGGGGGALFLG